MNNILEVKNLAKTYDGGVQALIDCSFSLASSKICAVVGESGSGKTTLLRLIAGLEHPSNGEVLIKEKVMSDDLNVVSPQKRHVGLVSQDFSLFPHLTVSQNIEFGLDQNQKHRVKELLELIKMENYANSYPNELSGGQEQRVALVRTLALKPELVLLDEPFSNLDVGLKSTLRHEIKKLVNQFKLSMIFITHDLFDAIDIADEIIFLKDGLVLKKSSTSEFFKKIENADIKAMVDDLKQNSSNLLELDS